jgi:hypothetical protein
MKKILNNILCVAFASWFLTAAVGYNVVKYCCSGCAASEISSNIALCGKENSVEQDDCCSGLSHEEKAENTDKHCSLIYVKADFPAVEHFDNQNLAPKVFDLPIIFSHNDFLIEFYTKKYQTNLIKNPPNLCGRDILITKSVLLI